MKHHQQQTVSQYDIMTKTPVSRLIIGLSIPTIISVLVTNIYNLVDTAFVGQLGTSASGAVGVVFGFMAVIQAIGYLFGQGAGSILSRALGKKDKESASLHASAGFFLSFTAGLLVGVIGLFFLHDIVMILGSTETIAPYAETYITYILISSAFMCSSLTLNNMLSYEGKAKLGMIGLMVGAVLNMAGDPFFMFALDMGIAGAGLSTALSQIISWMVLMAMYLCGKTEAKIAPRYMGKIRLSVVGNICATGFPSLLRQGLNSLATVLLNARCAVYGDAAVAAMSIVSRIIFFSFSVALGIGQGMQPVAGFNYGAGKYSRVRRGFRFTVVIAESIIIVGSVLLIIFAPDLIELFRSDPEVVEIGTRALILQAIASLALPGCMMTEMLLQSTGKRVHATLLSSLRNGLLFIPTLLILAHFRGLAGIQEAMPVALALSLPVAAPFTWNFFRKLPKQDREEEPDDNSEKE